MTFGEFLDNAYQGLRRAMPVLIPGFAMLWALHASANFGEFAAFYAVQANFGGFLILLVVLPFACAVLGLLIQAARVVLFDLIREQVQPGELDPESRHTMHYALYANLAIAWPLMYLIRQLSIRHVAEVTKLVAGKERLVELVWWGDWPWASWGNAVLLLLVLWVEIGLCRAAMRCFQRAMIAPPAARKKTAKKKSTRSTR